MSPQLSVISSHIDPQHDTRAGLLTALGATENGLSTAEAKERLDQFGPNEPATTRTTAGVVQLLLFLVNPLVIILLLSSVVAGLLGDLVSATLIAVMVLLSVSLNFVQTFRSQHAADRLRA